MKNVLGVLGKVGGFIGCFVVFVESMFLGWRNLGVCLGVKDIYYEIINILYLGKIFVFVYYIKVGIEVVKIVFWG